MSKILRIEKRHPKTALENLNRLTGLEFEHWPESLLMCGEDVAANNLEQRPEEKPGRMADGMAQTAHHGT